jgi:hypothetical protein
MAKWKDVNSNEHDLEYVLERGGSPQRIGVPVAFIETAWRRYTKHSRNKVQEIQGAITPLVATHRNSAPFTGAILAGEFTNNALLQLKSLGFEVLHISYQDVLAAFAFVKIDASFGERTEERVFRAKLKAWDRLGPAKRKRVASRLLESNKNKVDEFIAALVKSISRTISGVFVMPLHGSSNVLASVNDAIAFISSYNEDKEKMPVVEYVVQIRYSNADKVEGRFGEKSSALDFLGNSPLTVR